MNQATTTLTRAGAQRNDEVRVALISDAAKLHEDLEQALRQTGRSDVLANGDGGVAKTVR